MIVDPMFHPLSVEYPIKFRIGDEFFALDYQYVSQFNLNEKLSKHHNDIVDLNLTQSDTCLAEFWSYRMMQLARSQWYSQYTTQCMGRVLHFLYVYGGLDLSDKCVICKVNEINNIGPILKQDVPIANYYWRNNLPTINFHAFHRYTDKEKMKQYVLNQSIYHKYLRLERFFGVPNDIIYDETKKLR